MTADPMEPLDASFDADEALARHVHRMSDRELLEAIFYDINAAKRVVTEIKGQVEPMMEKLSKSPLLKMIGGK